MRPPLTRIWQCIFTVLVTYHCFGSAAGMTKEEKRQLKEQTKEMFYHAYHSYMDNAYPADELMSLSCKGRYRGSEATRGDVDDSLGNFSLSLIDTLDTLIVLGDFDEFESATKLVIRDVTFETDVVVSVFETNIRVMGGLISGHVFAAMLRDTRGRMVWYRDELLLLAKDLGYRLLPAFNTTSGMPLPRVNLRYGLKGLHKVEHETCTACAGTMVLEFAALSRLTGEPIFEEKAHRAMEFLWQARHRTSHLMGTVLNVHNGEWVRRDSGVGAGIDSYYEYLLKAYILLGDETYLERFNKHYSSVMKYVSQGPMLVDVHMHRPHTASRNFMTSLLAFWPGLQVLFGDIKPAIETHEMLYQVIQRHKFLPEAFTTEFKVYWGQHPLRPEFIESTYFLYKATGDAHYLEVGRSVLESLNQYARVPCGFAAVKDVRTGSHEDRMDSFVLAELFKYLYLLFAEDEDIPINIDDYVFTTEAHLLPLTLSKAMNPTGEEDVEYNDVASKRGDELMAGEDENEYKFRRSCPNNNAIFPGENFAQVIRLRLKNMVEEQCPKPKTFKRRLRASEFEAGNVAHMTMLERMGIRMVTLKDARVQLMHTANQAATLEEGEEGLLFMQEMIELSNNQNNQVEHQPRVIQFLSPPYDGRVVLTAGPAQFGIELKGSQGVHGRVVVATPLKGCGALANADEMKGAIGIVERGDCMFVEKARNLVKVGAIAGIVLDNNLGTSSSTAPMFAMSGDGSKDIFIPMVFLFQAESQILLHALGTHTDLQVLMTDAIPTSGAAGTAEKGSKLADDTLSARTDGVTVQMVDIDDDGTRLINTQKRFFIADEDDVSSAHSLECCERRDKLFLFKQSALQNIKSSIYLADFVRALWSFRFHQIADHVV
ncbi:PREDICTED: ER degradation-enhancing alpha-mannosidase-like protein 3 [Priapulus caudatus]|uniref:alpha-1,2-Mannosidase n=1 Tax=Priapulus caudatus TaxID=37621 RepID=A0ABM1EFU6_PRICU|nr:PREDICTED: ER degradation-enhancing alpha-mannosidase-like protein 3 [Priapulus caudatus]